MFWNVEVTGYEGMKCGNKNCLNFLISNHKQKYRAFHNVLRDCKNLL